MNTPQNKLYDVFCEDMFQGYCWAASEEEAIEIVCGPESERGNFHYTANCGE